MEIMGVKKRTGSKTDSKFRVIPSKSKIRKGFMAIELSYQIGVILFLWKNISIRESF